MNATLSELSRIFFLNYRLLEKEKEVFSFLKFEIKRNKDIC